MKKKLDLFQGDMPVTQAPSSADGLIYNGGATIWELFDQRKILIDGRCALEPPYAFYMHSIVLLQGAREESPHELRC